MSIKRKLYAGKRYIKAYNKKKIFCIGANKTGTTSLKSAMKELGYSVGNQSRAESLLPAWAQRNFHKIVKYCYSAQFFQDIPFSLPYTYVALDQAFPRSKYILTIRDNTEQWYNSITKSHANLWGRNGNLPTERDLKLAKYNYKGGVWRSFNLIFNTPKSNLYSREDFFKFYENHNKEVIEYFRHRPNDLLILNVAEKGAYRRLCNFLEIEKLESTEFPWKNKTKSI
jgi:hypothetical protein